LPLAWPFRPTDTTPGDVETLTANVNRSDVLMLLAVGLSSPGAFSFKFRSADVFNDILTDATTLVGSFWEVTGHGPVVIQGFSSRASFFDSVPYRWQV
jgi:hypothetical protein